MYEKGKSIGCPNAAANHLPKKGSGTRPFKERLCWRCVPVGVKFRGYFQDQSFAEFNHTRNFLFLRESDFHSEFEKYRLKPILKAADGGIFRIESGSILGKLAFGLPDYVQYDEPSYYFVATADQCLEIACFEEPKLRLIE